MPNPWIEHVKKYARDNGITYCSAISQAGPSYHAMKRKQPTQRESTRTRRPPALAPGEFSDIARERDRDSMPWSELDSKAKYLMSKSIPIRPKRQAAKPKAFNVTAKQHRTNMLTTRMQSARYSDKELDQKIKALMSKSIPAAKPKRQATKPKRKTAKRTDKERDRAIQAVHAKKNKDANKIIVDGLTLKQIEQAVLHRTASPKLLDKLEDLVAEGYVLSEEQYDRLVALGTARSNLRLYPNDDVFINSKEAGIIRKLNATTDMLPHRFHDEDEDEYY